VPSYKDMQQELTNKDLSTYGFLGYPLLQTADIVLYDGNKVPVGADQVPHIEFSREVVRRFNHLYGKTLVEPQPLLTAMPKLLGLDRRKMSKSYNNGIFLTDSAAEIEAKVKTAITDPARIRKNDPGHPEVCLIYDYHKIHSDPKEVEQVERDCRSGQLGCVDDKKRMAAVINDFLAPIRSRREQLLKNPAKIDEIIRQGSQKAREVASQTMTRVKKAMRL
ncbi:MAG: tryptophan--tRNA ligase, partial [Deltaproteobacteria bacterium]|nr:tryptophan--tRNA ligase [Deltaproteobacteria bacterium]